MCSVELIPLNALNLEHMAGHSKKALAVKSIIRNEFTRHRNETDPKKVESLRNGAMQGIANYLLVESLNRLKRKSYQKENPVELPLDPAQAEQFNLTEEDIKALKESAAANAAAAAAAKAAAKDTSDLSSVSSSSSSGANSSGSGQSQ